jgi:hypothetical protein
MRVAQWARLQTPARCGLRWGAWYPVMGLTAREAQVWVRGRALPVARSLLELRSTPPREWTVARTKGATDPYLVCPSCRHRAHLPDGRVATLRCPRCNELFTIAWDDRASAPAARATTPPSRDELKPDRRMTRRRMVRDRRTGPERREVERRAVVWAPPPTERRVTDRREAVYRRSGWDRRAMVERRRRVTAW